MEMLAIAQCFSLIPVGGIQAASAEGLYISRGSWRNRYATIAPQWICCLCHPMPETFRIYVHTAYPSIVELIDKVHVAVSGIMLISFGSNLYFVCLQLLITFHNYNFKPIISDARLRFSGSPRSPEPVRQLRLVSAEGYHEVVDGNIVTNELVLIQFYEDTSRPPTSPLHSKCYRRLNTLSGSYQEHAVYLELKLSLQLELGMGLGLGLKIWYEPVCLV
ncbi:GH12673 [Drosophila grimshawi]|uniref:GH12673 n=1 Tax=Drosophila grimshawi TaxID=7222 RepID=B4JKJ3_DROGR|nr:GH12673 [Drosophila grimshawi]